MNKIAYDSETAYGEERCEICEIPLGWEKGFVSLFRAGVAPRHFHRSCFEGFRQAYAYLPSAGEDPSLDAPSGR